jgi:molybdopterin-guanine dinucleotide biosynthesis protein MobB
LISNAKVPMFGFVAFSGTGKTTLLQAVIKSLRARGLRIGVVKHAHHQFEMDTPGKDSYLLRNAGATQMLIASSQRWALLADDPHPEADLNNVVRHLDQESIDLILVEGFKYEAFPKMELHRLELKRPLLHPNDADIVAVACDQPDALDTQLPRFSINDSDTIADFIIEFCQVQTDDRQTTE